MRLANHRLGSPSPPVRSRQRSLLWGLLAVLLAGSSVEATPRPVLLIGDSHTAGGVSGPSGPPFSVLLANLLGPEYLVVNAGIGGASSFSWKPVPSCAQTLYGQVCLNGRSLYDRNAKPLLQFDWGEPLIATVMLGTNDASGFFLPAPSSPAAYLRNIETLTASLLADGASTVLLLPPPPFPDFGSQIANANSTLESYRSLLLDHCRSTPGVRCGPDAFSLIDPVSDFFASDIHMNAEGHAKLAAALRGSILSVPEPPLLSLLAVGLAGLAILGGVPFKDRRSPRPQMPDTKSCLPHREGAEAGLSRTA